MSIDVLEFANTYENSKNETATLEKEKETISKKPQNDPEFRRYVYLWCNKLMRTD